MKAITNQNNKITKNNVVAIANQILQDFPLLEDKLKKAFNDKALNSSEALTEGLKFLTLAGSTPASLTPSQPIDLIWHELILFTKFYANFCLENFGRFLHHLPDDDKGKNHVQFHKTLRLYSLYFGEPPMKFWGESPFNVGALSSCGSCQSFSKE